MASSLVKGVFVLVVFALALGMLVPTLMDATQNDASDVYEMGENDSVSPTDSLTMTVVDLNTTEQNVTVDLKDRQTLDNQTLEINGTESRQYSLSGDNVTVSAGQIYQSTNQVRLTVSYPPMFGWDDGARLFMENIGVLLILVAGSMVVGVFIYIKP